LAPTFGVLTSTIFGKASTFVMSPKKIIAPGAALQPLDTNQETLSLREARSQHRKATNPTLQEEELDQEIRDLEIIHQQMQRKKEKMARLADLQKKIDEATEEVCHLTQDDHDQRPQHRELRQEGSFNEDEWYDDFNHGSFTFDDASPLAAELQAIPWPQSYKPPQQQYPHMEATQLSWQSPSSWQSEMWPRHGTLLSGQGQSRHGRSSRTCWLPVFKAFRRSQSQLRPCSSAHKTMRNTFRRMSEGSCD
jgi:hypothetical protein